MSHESITMENRQLSIRSRLALFVAVPLVSLLVLSFTLSMTQRHQFEQADRHREFVHLSKTLVNTMVAMQMERAALSENFDAPALNQTEGVTNQALQVLSLRLPTPYGYFDLEPQFNELIELLQQLPDVRGATRPDHEIAAYYSIVIQHIVVILQSLVVDAKDVKLYREIETLLDLLQLTETAQLERYAVLQVIRRGAIDKDTLSALRSVEVSQMHHAERILWLSGRAVSSADLFPAADYIQHRELAINNAIRQTTAADLLVNLSGLLSHKATLASLQQVEGNASTARRTRQVNSDIEMILGELSHQNVGPELINNLVIASSGESPDLIASQRAIDQMAVPAADQKNESIDRWKQLTRQRVDSIYRIQKEYESSVLMLTRQHWQGVKLQFWLYVGGSLLVLVVTIALGFLLARRVVGGLVEMTEKIRVMDQTHELMPALPAAGTDELAHLARSFNDLVRKLNAADVREKALQRSLLEIERRQNADLERRVEIRTRELEKARVEAEAANQAKSRFLGNISHHVRTPLNAIQGFTQLLARDELNAGQHQKLATIQENGDQLLTMMDNILSLVRLEKGEIKPELAQVDLTQFFAEIEKKYQQRAAAGTTDFRFLGSELPSVRLDGGLLQGALHEILDNAFKFTKAGSVELQVTHAEEQIHVIVRDSGKGIAPDQLEQLVGTFEQATAGCEMGGGIGIGLTLVSHRMDVLGGDMTITSTPGVGTEVLLSIPAAEIPSDNSVLIADGCNLQRLPTVLTARLRDSVVAADVIALGHIIEEVRSIDDLVAEQLAAMLESYDFDALTRMTAAA